MSNLITSTDGLGHQTQYGYDALYRKTSITDATGQITQISYDANGNLTSLIDPSHNSTQYQYDALNRVITDTNALNHNRTYRYDAVGNLTQTTDRNSRTRSFNYDALDRQTQENWLDNTGTAIRTSTATYDSAGQIITISDPDSKYTYSYDLAGRLTTVDNTGTPNTPSVIMTYGYDAANNLISVTDSINGQQKGTTAYSYDILNRTTQITQSGNGVTDKRINLAYNKANQTTQIARYSDLNGNLLVAQSNYSYDSSGRLIQLNHNRNSTIYANYQWSYDSSNRITQFISPDGTNGYSYNSRDELTGTDSNYQTDEVYSYDATGNRTNAGYQTGTNNRLLSDGTFTYTYDNEGNRTSRTNINTGELTQYSWDYDNRLTNVTTKDTSGSITKSVAYTYDVYGHRITKSIDADGAGPATSQKERMVYDGYNIALTFDGNGIQTHRYLHGLGVDQILADETQTSVNWALVDNLGSVRDIIDSSGTVLDHIVYDSYGNITSQTNPSVEFRYGYTGREHDLETGLSFYQSRYYDTATGAFISEDSIGFLGGDQNLYRYVGNSPTNYTDPFGYFRISSWKDLQLATRYGFNKAFQKGVETLGKAAPFVKGFGGKLLGPLGTVVDVLGNAEPVADDTLEGARRTINGNRKKATVSSPLPSPSPAPNPASVDEPNCQEEKEKKKCKAIPYHMHRGGGGEGYATWVTGSSVDYDITAPKAGFAAFDGLVTSDGELYKRYHVPLGRHVAEVKSGTKTPTFKTKDGSFLDIYANRFLARAIKDFNIANECNYKYSFVLEDKRIFERLEKLVPKTIPVYWIP